MQPTIDAEVVTLKYEKQRNRWQDFTVNVNEKEPQK